MSRKWGITRNNTRLVLGAALALILLACLLINRLGSLLGGLSSGEIHTATTTIGWHGLYRQPLFLPLEFIRSVVFFFFPHHGQTLTRLPNVIFGGFAIINFCLLIRLWHSARVALLTGTLFATSAWVLHVSRLASFDVMFLWGITTLLLSNALIYRHADKPWVWYGSLAFMGALLYLPGFIWLIPMNLYLLRRHLREGWRRFSGGLQRSLTIATGIIWLPLLMVDLVRHGQLLLWFGLPQHLASPGQLLKHLVGVPVHLFIRGPQYPDVWLGKAPLLDIFTLLACLLGLYFYATHFKAGRSRLLGVFFLTGWVLVALGGPVSLSLLVPLLYVMAATGIAYLLHEWLRVFPLNPIARGLGLSLIGVAVALACLYNLRAYFVAWPHNPPARTTFHYHL